MKLDRNKKEIYTSTLDGKVVVIDEESLNNKDNRCSFYCLFKFVLIMKLKKYM